MNAPLLPPPDTPDTHVVDLAVLGAGPAGATAARVAAAAGLEVVLLDEADAPGGQVWRAPPAGFPGPDNGTGERLRRALEGGAVRFLGGRRAWSVVRIEAAHPFRVDFVGPEGNGVVIARALVAALGTTERAVPFPGWTLPGVVGLAGARLLLRASDALPGRRTVVAGTGPLLAAVAAGILKKGGEVAAVVDLSGRAAWARALPALLQRPRSFARGAARAARIRVAGVPVLSGHAVRAARGTAALEAVEAGPVDRRGAPRAGPVRRFEADALAVGNGLVPATEVTRLLGARHVFDRPLGGWRPALDEHGRTSVPGLYVAGDGGGVTGVGAARLSGRLAGAAAVADLAGRRGPGRTRSMILAMRRRALAGRALSRLTALRPGQVAAIGDDTVVCRCEDVTAGAIRAAVRAGASEVNQLKHFTRCGMGPCQGRLCADVAAELVALAVAGTDDPLAVDSARRRVGQWTGRVPLRPVPVASLVGTFDYADIPVPPPPAL